MEQASEKPLVVVTGVTGYCGSWVALKLLQEGSYRVRGTVRDKNNAAKLDPLRRAFGEELYGQLELGEADLLDDASMSAVIAGATFVVHVASPYRFGAREEDMIPPAVNGTLAVMKACREHRVKRCIYTGSGLAVFKMAEADQPADQRFDETMWSNPDIGLEPYTKSKTLAERAAWDFVAGLPEEERFELVSVLPSCVFGPPLRTEEASSITLCHGMMTGEMNPIMRVHWPVVDVRDVADCHVKAIQVPAAAGQRFICSESSHWIKDVAAALRERYGNDGWPISDQEAEEGTPGEPIFVNTKSKEVLGMEYIPMRQSICDMAQKMIELGLLSKPE